jgi:ATP-dependent helicase/nuclease subunit A
VDEYQDVNEVQHLLFEALAGPRGRFMVGDVKQSIYGFRGAQPEIFARTRRAFPPLQAAGESEEATLTLSANFRSDKPILDFVNMVFGGLMQGVGANIGYDSETDGLRPGVDKTPQAARVTVALFEKGSSADEPTEESGEEELPEGETPDAEACYVAGEIAQLLRDGLPGGRQLLPGDIAILVRKASVGERFVHALTARGIRVDRPRGKGFFLNPEILLAVSLLNVIDNPRRDIYLAGLLHSPLYGFTPDDLTAIRREADAAGHAGCTLYEALCDYLTAHPTFEKGAYFLAELAEFRRMAEGLPIDRLIRELYRRTGLLSLAGADKNGSPEARRANLMLLYDYARRFEASSFRGLYNFISYINEVIARDESIEEGRLQSDRADTVRIMTMHQSKGLEFPVCFVVGAGAPFNLQDATAPLLFEREMGCALKLRDASGLARIKNPVYNTIGARIREKQLEEEMRVLYVAMTRPYHKLYLTGSLKGELSEWVAEGQARGRSLGKREVYACRSYAEMVLATLQDAPFCELLFPETEKEHAEGIAPAAPETAVQLDPAAVAEAEAILSARFAYEYPDRYLGDLPSKLSVSRLYPGVLDEGDEPVPSPAPPAEEPTGEEMAEKQAAYKPAPLPRFLGGEREDAAARAGTATHLFMQFCDFSLLAQQGAAAELARLTARQFITEEDAALVRLEEVEAFCRSSLLAALTEEGTRLYREQRFHIHLPATSLTRDGDRRAALEGERVLVQGVMDAVLCRKDGTLWLIDYKTDRLSPYELRNRSAAEKKLRDRHGSQLAYYAEACRLMFGRLPDRVLLYSLALGDTVDIPVSDLAL